MYKYYIQVKFKKRIQRITVKKASEQYISSFLQTFSELSPEAIDFIRSYISIESYNKKDHLYQRGEVQKSLGYVCEGLLRRYYINEDGKKISTGFTNENKYITDYPSFLRQIPSKYGIECLEPSVIIKLPYEKLQESYAKFKSSEMYGRLMAEQVLIFQTDRVESFLFKNAEERYLTFLEQEKDLVNRISLSHLASYIGIERQSLSRIRSKLARK